MNCFQVGHLRNFYHKESHSEDTKCDCVCSNYIVITSHIVYVRGFKARDSEIKHMLNLISYKKDVAFKGFYYCFSKWLGEHSYSSQFLQLWELMYQELLGLPGLKNKQRSSGRYHLPMNLIKKMNFYDFLGLSFTCLEKRLANS